MTNKLAPENPRMEFGKVVSQQGESVVLRNSFGESEPFILKGAADLDLSDTHMTVVVLNGEAVRLRLGGSDIKVLGYGKVGLFATLSELFVPLLLTLLTPVGLFLALSLTESMRKQSKKLFPETGAFFRAFQAIGICMLLAGVALLLQADGDVQLGYSGLGLMFLSGFGMALCSAIGAWIVRSVMVHRINSLVALES
jgi:hypothetical protein